MFGFGMGVTGLWFVLIALWTLPWKGYALWLAARNNQPWWFIILLVMNTLAILEIIYIFAIGRPELKKHLPAQAGEDHSSSPAS
ncbi:hypothetical protein HY090_00785 [Candidatus Kaiserbacteria bacterium]|nr:hypothetical protein [Candidatus Kaiserbacteria bacterium]